MIPIDLQRGFILKGMKDMSRKWDPLCFKDNNYEHFGTTATGYITPCCYCDKYGKDISDYDPLLSALYDEELKLENNDSIEEIILSDQWKEFYDAIAIGPEHAPRVCKRICWRENDIKILS